MFYNGTSVEADKVIYDQKTKRLHAEGNIRMTDAAGKVTYANIMDLSDDYRDGFVDSLRVDTEDATRMAATRACGSTCGTGSTTVSPTRATTRCSRSKASGTWRPGPRWPRRCGYSARVAGSPSVTWSRPTGCPAC
jgi:LPS-assembly protein